MCIYIQIHVYTQTNSEVITVYIWELKETHVTEAIIYVSSSTQKSHQNEERRDPRRGLMNQKFSQRGGAAESCCPAA